MFPFVKETFETVRHNAGDSGSCPQFQALR